MSAAEGKFFSNEFVGDVMPCSKEDGYDSAVEADMAAYQARSFLQVGRHARSSCCARWSLVAKAPTSSHYGCGACTAPACHVRAGKSDPISVH